MPKQSLSPQYWVEITKINKDDLGIIIEKHNGIVILTKKLKTKWLQYILPEQQLWFNKEEGVGGGLPVIFKSKVQKDKFGWVLSAYSGPRNRIG